MSHRFGYLGMGCGFVIAMAGATALSTLPGPSGFAVGAIMGCIIPTAGYLLGDNIDEKCHLRGA